MKTRIIYQLDMIALSHLLQKSEDQITPKEMFFVIGLVTRCFSAAYVMSPVFPDRRSRKAGCSKLRRRPGKASGGVP